MTHCRKPIFMRLTLNEAKWIEFIRLISDRDPEPTLAAVQALRQALDRRYQRSSDWEYQC